MYIYSYGLKTLKHYNDHLKRVKRTRNTISIQFSSYFYRRLDSERDERRMCVCVWFFIAEVRSKTIEIFTRNSNYVQSYAYIVVFSLVILVSTDIVLISNPKNSLELLNVVRQ